MPLTYLMYELYKYICFAWLSCLQLFENIWHIMKLNIQQSNIISTKEWKKSIQFLKKLISSVSKQGVLERGDEAQW